MSKNIAISRKLLEVASIYQYASEFVTASSEMVAAIPKFVPIEDAARERFVWYIEGS